MSTQEEQEHGRDAMVHTLLQEELACPEAHHENDILARFAAGDGEQAAARLDARGEVRQGWLAQRLLAQRWPLLCAALALIALAATFANSWMGDDKSGNNKSGNNASAQNPNKTDPVKQDPIRDFDLAGLQKLLPEVEHIFIEALWLPDSRISFDIELQGAPIEVQPGFRQVLLTALAEDAEETAAIDADWMNQVHLVLKDGRRIRMALYPYPKNESRSAPSGIRLQVAGMKKDLYVTDGGGLLPDLVNLANHAGKQAHGIITSRGDLQQQPETAVGLDLYLLADEDLALLSRFKNLHKLDCTGLQHTLHNVGLRHIRKNCPELRELTLDGMQFNDNSVIQITDLVHITKLSLRGVRGFTGTGFEYYSLSALHRDGPTTVDLSFVATLTDEGLKRICEWEPATLILRNSSKGITAAGFRALEQTKNLRRIDLRGWDLSDEAFQATMRTLQQRAGLTIIR